MSGQRKPWQTKNSNVARCLACGAVSYYRILFDWARRCNGKSKNYDYWGWWRKFKKAHNKCAGYHKWKKEL